MTGSSDRESGGTLKLQRFVVAVVLAIGLGAAGWAPVTSADITPTVAFSCGSFDEPAGTVTVAPLSVTPMVVRQPFVTCAVTGTPLLPVPASSMTMSLPAIPTVLNSPFDPGWDGVAPAGYRPTLTTIQLTYRSSLDFTLHTITATVSAQLVDLGVLAFVNVHALRLTISGVSFGSTLPGLQARGSFLLDAAALSTGTGGILLGPRFELLNTPMPANLPNGPITCAASPPSSGRAHFTTVASPAVATQVVSETAKKYLSCEDSLGLGITTALSSTTTLRGRQDNDPTTDVAGETLLTGTMTVRWDDGNPLTAVTHSTAAVIANFVSGSAGGSIQYRVAGLIKSGVGAGSWIERIVTVNHGTCVPAGAGQNCPMVAAPPFTGYPFGIAP